MPDHMDNVPTAWEQLAEARAEIKRLQVEFFRHSAAAAVLYADIYDAVESALGERLPAGCLPLQAVNMLADRYRETREC